MRLPLYIFLLLCCLTCSAFLGSARAQQYDFKNFQVNDGLSSNTVTSVLQDRSGFVWVGTRSGLNRYDGRHFKVFRNDRNARFSLGNNGVLCLFEDSSHHIWVGTYTGIYVYYPEQEKFLWRKDLPLGEIRFIHSTSDGYIWIGTHNQLYRYQPRLKKLSFMWIPQGETLVCNSQNDDSRFWIASGNRYLLRYDTLRHLFTPFQLPEKIGKSWLSNIQDMSSVGDSAVLIGTMKGAFYLQLHTRKIVMLPQNGLPGLQIHQILHRNHWEYWLGTENGVVIYNIKNNTGNRFSRQSNNPYSLTDNVVYTLCKDSEDGVWIGTFSGGLNYYSHNWNFFRRYFPNSLHSPLSGHIVHEITEDDRGNIWVGTEDDGLDELSDGTTHVFLPNGKRQSIAYKNIHGTAAVGNELWVGTYEHGLDVLDIPSGKVVRHYHKGEKPGSLDGDFIVTIYKGQQDKIYVGTWNSLFEYDRAKDNFRKVPFLNVQIQQVAQAKDGTLWVASYGKGIYFYNEKTGQHGHLSNQSDNGAIASNYVNNITLDNHGKIWAATENGLFVYDPHRQQTQTFPDSFGFSHGQVFKIVQDNYGRYWISTSNGLYCYDPTSHKQWQYTVAYGLPSQQFNYNSGFRDKKGNLYFGTVNGMIRFYPPRTLDNSFDPPVFITGWKINNIVSDSLLATNNHSPARDIRLYYYQSNLSLDVSALTYGLPGTTKLMYKLDDFDKEWNAVPANGNVLYPKLSPGKYVFKVKNADKNYPGSESSITFTIAPPFWASAWAYFLYTLMAGGIIFLLLRYYFLALKEKQKRILDAFENQKQKEIYASKIDFFTHVAHEIRTPLTLIKLPLEKLKEKEIFDEQSRQNIILMEKNTNRLIDLTNELLDFRKAESNNYRLNFTDVDITRLVQKAVETFGPLAEQKSMQLLVDMPRLHLIASADAEAMQKILNNLVNNAVKYGASKVRVLLEPFGSDDTFFTIRVSSDGPLIPKDKKNKIFEPFARLEETAKEVGTGIGLPLSRALTQLHNGTLELDETNDINTFALRLPVEQNETIHLQDVSTEDSDEPLTLPQQDMDADKANVLLVEDNIDILLFVQKELKEDYNIFTIQNGRQALELLDEVQIDLVVTDIMMPVMDGMELCQKIKEDMRFSHIPVIMLTAKNTLASKIEGLETGADAYIEKPFSMDYLRAQIKSILQNRQIMVKHFASSPLAHIKSMGMNTKDKDFLDTLQNLINAHIMSENLDVRELANMLNMSKATLYRKIKSISKLSPNELINLTRLKHAAELLAEGKYRISEVAVMTGYTVQGNFSRDFNKQFGMTPSQFMETLKK